MNVVDIFAGAGGWGVGMKPLGIREVGLEWDKDACRTRAAAGLATIRADVAQYPPEAFRGWASGLVGSPPCPPFSSAGGPDGLAQLDALRTAIRACSEGWTDDAVRWEAVDSRTPLVLQPLRWAWALQPEWMAFEQVPGALPVWREIADVFCGWGYSASTVVINSADYGVPQTRKRAVLVACRGELSLPSQSHAKVPHGRRERWISMGAGLGWSASDAYARRVHPEATSGDLAWIFNRPATTLVSTFRADVIAAPGYRTYTGVSRHNQPGSVITTIPEQLALQSFPSDHPVHGSKSAQHRQVGNAFPPRVVEALVGALIGARPSRRVLVHRQTELAL